MFWRLGLWRPSLTPLPFLPFLPPTSCDVWGASLISFVDPVCNPICSGYTTEPDHCTVPWWGRAAAAKQNRRRAASEWSSDFRILFSFVTTVASLTGGKTSLKLRGTNAGLVPPNSEVGGPVFLGSHGCCAYAICAICEMCYTISKLHMHNFANF